MQEVRNIFLIGRSPGAEDQLTEMLVWLASAVVEVGAAVVRLGLGAAAAIEVAQIEGSTQQRIVQGRLDALFETQSVTLVVESKLGSSYGEGQLRRYLEWLSTERKTRPLRGLMTLTEKVAPWPPTELAHAENLGITASPRRWEDLYEALSGVAEMPDLDRLAVMLVRQFLDMLNEEGLIPMKPLLGDELLDAWSRSQAVITRFHTYFRASKDAMAEALEAKAHSNRSSAQATYIYQDFETEYGEFVGVGINYSDRGFPLTPKIYRDAPIVWFTVEAYDWPEWNSAIVCLEEAPPAGWRLNPERWYGRPQIWRYLDEVIGDGSFAEQQDGLASACREAGIWLATCRPAGYRHTSQPDEVRSAGWLRRRR